MAPLYGGCVVEGCHREHRARGYCGTHYNTLISRAGSPRRASPIHLEDVEWMAETGEVWDRAVERLGVKENTLRKHLERHGRYDLIRKLRRREMVA